MTTLVVTPLAGAPSFIAFATVPQASLFGPLEGRGEFPAIGLTGSYSDDIGQLKMIKLDRLQGRLAIVTDERQPSHQFQLIYQRNTEATEQAIRALATGQGNLSALVQGLLQTQAAVRETNERIAVAEAQAAATADYNRVRDSYSDAGVLSATNVGGSATVTIAAHQRHYLDPTESVPLAGATLTGQPAATTLYVFYEDPELNGGSVVYQTTTDEAAAVATMASPYRHKVGTIATPNTVGGGSEGETFNPPWRDQRLPEP